MEGGIQGAYKPARTRDGKVAAAREGRGERAGDEHPVTAVDWVSLLKVDRASSPRSSMSGLKLYREFKVTAAGKAWRDRDFFSAVSAFRQAADTCAEFGDTDRALRLLEKGELARNRRDMKTVEKGNYERYFFALQARLNKAFNDRNLDLARDLLKQMVVISKSVKDADLFKAYKSQLGAVEAVYKGKGSKHVHLDKIMRARLIDSLRSATDRAGLAFKRPYIDQASILAPLCSIT
ncbi:MAG: hypothetical protein GYA24_02650 [Candidatus Lokiarchaeota archaeon]|nr:hypothetical protein [Candidatus Lokiarchaeota archaeon]